MTLFAIALGAGVLVAILLVASLGPATNSGWFDGSYDGGDAGWDLFDD
jgi:hypothetical protein